MAGLMGRFRLRRLCSTEDICTSIDPSHRERACLLACQFAAGLGRGGTMAQLRAQVPGLLNDGSWPFAKRSAHLFGAARDCMSRTIAALVFLQIFLMFFVKTALHPLPIQAPRIHANRSAVPKEWHGFDLRGSRGRHRVCDLTKDRHGNQ